MADDAFTFDPTLMKKKKKKKTVAVIDEPAAVIIDEILKKDTDQITNDLSDIAIANKKKKALDMGEEKDMDDMGELCDFDPASKKKKKKKKEFVLDDGTANNDIEELVDFDMTAKKKKKKKGVLNLDDELGDDAAQEEGGDSWLYSTRDYTFEEMLKRASDLMNDKNPGMKAGEKKKFIMKPPQVVRHGSKKTSFCNFVEITNLLHRNRTHVQAYLMAELGTSGSVDSHNQLIIKGRFQAKNIEGVLKRYIKEYVTCHTCRSPETLLEKDARLNFLKCTVCQSRCSVQIIKSGFQAVTGKRKQLRAKQG